MADKAYRVTLRVDAWLVFEVEAANATDAQAEAEALAESCDFSSAEVAELVSYTPSKKRPERVDD